MPQFTRERRPASREVEREARRILPLLARTGAHAVGARPAGGSVAVHLRAAQKRPTAIVGQAVFDEFRRTGWVQCSDDRTWRLSESGRNWLMRRSPDGDGFADQHRLVEERGVEMPGGGWRRARVNAGEDPLGWLARRKGPDGERFLSEEMVAAGERLRSDFTRAQLLTSTTTDWSRLSRDGGGRRSGAGAGAGACELTEVALAARQRFERALTVLGGEAAGLVVDVCCFLIGLEHAESARGWPKRSAKIALRLCLGQLATHYGLRRCQEPGRSSRSHLWRAGSGRPATSEEA